MHEFVDRGKPFACDCIHIYMIGFMKIKTKRARVSHMVLPKMNQLRKILTFSDGCCTPGNNASQPYRLAISLMLLLKEREDIGHRTNFL
jgi:hypothetical protein